MGTAIYEGLKSTHKDVFDATKAIKAVLEPLFFDKFEKFVDILEEKANAGTDESWCDLLEFDSLPELNQWPWNGELHSLFYPERDLHNFVTLLHKADSQVVDRFNFGYTVSLLENGNKHGNPLVMVRTADRDYHAALLRSDAVVDYGYWTTSDADEDASPQEWRARKKAWSNVYQPYQEGLNFSFPSQLRCATELRRRAGGTP